MLRDPLKFRKIKCNISYLKPASTSFKAVRLTGTSLNERLIKTHFVNWGVEPPITFNVTCSKNRIQIDR